MNDLSTLRVAVLATDGFEESELIEPIKAIREAGGHVAVVSLQPGKIQGFRHDSKGQMVDVDKTFEEVDANQFDGVLLPGGALNAVRLRVVPEVQAFLQEMQEAGKPIAAICHAPWELISAGLVRGRRLTGYHTIRDDIRNAGGDWIDQEVVEDDNWITSRQPSDIPAFNKAMLELFSRTPAHR